MEERDDLERIETDVEDNDGEPDVLDKKPKLRRRVLSRPFLTPFIAALIYGFVIRLSYNSSPALNTLTYGFIGVMPIAIGAITVYLSSRTFRVTWFQALTAPWIPGFIFLLGVGIAIIEFSLCIVMASPLFLIAASIGGLGMNIVLRAAERFPHMKNSSPSLLIALLVAPYLVSAVETNVPAPDLYRTVDTQIIIDADPQTIWSNIIRVPHIRAEERSIRLPQLLGVPQPVEATLKTEGVYGVRRGYFDNGLIFIETITDWQPNEYIRFNIEIDRSASLPAPYEVLGGPFDIRDAAYHIQPLDDGRVLLTLSSTYRISTPINAYGRLWMDYFMMDFQNYVLEIVKKRCESAL